MARYQVGPAQVRAFRELTELLAKERIPTIMVWMPEGPLMRSFYVPEPLQTLRREFERVSKEHGFPLVNARSWLEEDCFWDSVHMTAEGGTGIYEATAGRDDCAVAESEVGGIEDSRKIKGPRTAPAGERRAARTGSRCRTTT